MSSENDWSRDEITAPVRLSTRSQRTTWRVVSFAPGEPVHCHVLDKRTLFGRADDCDVQLRDREVSRHHAVLRRPSLEGPLEIEDLDSVNGVRINGKPSRRSAVRPGDVLRLGSTLLVVERGLFATDPTEWNGSLAGLELRATIGRVQSLDRPILLLGPTGVGKGFHARELASKLRPGKPFVHVNCAELPRDLAASELFGAAKGAFTGAANTRTGLIAAAEGGVVFFDEIGTLSMELQANLLRVIEDRVVRQIGSSRDTPVNVGFIAATNLDVPSAIENGLFRSDLYFRMQGGEIHLPSLQQRRADIPGLFARATGMAPTSIPPSTLERLLLHEWRGNIRELLSVSAAATAEGTVSWTTVDRRLPIRSAAQETISRPGPKVERPAPEALRELLLANQFNIAAVAKLLKKSPTQVRRWMAMYGIER